ncbi:MAG: mRNA surveillance protein pelota [Thermoplasmatota archaeon]
MRVLYRDPRGFRLKLFIDNPDDLWHLYNILERGDRVGAMSSRREETGHDKLRQERGEKRRMWLEVEVQDVEFSEFSDRLRVGGPIREGPQDLGARHTLNIEAGMEVSITKAEWREHQIQILREAVEATARPILTFVSMDDEEALIATLHHHGVRCVSTIPSRLPGKDDGSRGRRKEEWFGEVLSALAQAKMEGPVVVCGPGFTREEFVRWGRERRPGLFEGCTVEGTGQSGMAGIYEMMKRGIVSRTISATRVGQETAAVEGLLTEIARSGPVAYGVDEVRRALEAGAVLRLLVTDEMMRSGRAEELFRMARGTGASYMVVSTAHEAGKRLAHLGGAGAILRYRAAGA